jgi:hypothetical protein
VERGFQQHIRRGDFVDHAQIAGLAPEIGEPATDDGFVVILQNSSECLSIVVSGHRRDPMAWSLA